MVAAHSLPDPLNAEVPLWAEIQADRPVPGPSGYTAPPEPPKPADGQKIGSSVEVEIGPNWTRHARERALERYGIGASDAQWRDAVASIWAALIGEVAPALLLGVHADGKERWRVRLAGEDVTVVYDPATACIVTVLGVTRGLGNRYQPRCQKLTGRRRRERRGKWRDEEHERA